MYKLNFQKILHDKILYKEKYVNTTFLIKKLL